MKKIIALMTLIVSSLVLVGVYTASAQDVVKKPSIARFTAVDFRVEIENSGSRDHSVFGQKILSPVGENVGNAYMVCTTIGRGGILGNGVRQCHGIYNLPRGKIVVQGSRHRRARYTLVITGGSGIYVGIGGTLDSFLSGIRPRTEELIFRIK